MHSPALSQIGQSIGWFEQRELELLLARERRLRVGRVDDHALAADLLAARLELGVLLDRDQALPALRDDREARVVAERADVDAERARGLEHVRALRTVTDLPSIVSVTCRGRGGAGVRRRRDAG